MLATSLIAAVTFWSPAPAGWTPDYLRALREAKEQNKLVLVNFTGSDWCTFCKSLSKEIFNTDYFRKWAKENVILLELDYPQGHRLPSYIEEQNAFVQSHYGVQTFPTVLLIEPNGRPYAKFGYAPMSPEQWTSTVNTAIIAYQNQNSKPAPG